MKNKWKNIVQRKKNKMKRTTENKNKKTKENKKPKKLGPWALLLLLLWIACHSELVTLGLALAFSRFSFFSNTLSDSVQLCLCC
jgi:hypothetical protein